jgi:hypothetical protein
VSVWVSGKQSGKARRWTRAQSRASSGHFESCPAPFDARHALQLKICSITEPWLAGSWSGCICKTTAIAIATTIEIPQFNSMRRASMESPRTESLRLRDDACTRGHANHEVRTPLGMPSWLHTTLRKCGKGNVGSHPDGVSLEERVLTEKTKLSRPNTMIVKRLRSANALSDQAARALLVTSFRDPRVINARCPALSVGFTASEWAKKEEELRGRCMTNDQYLEERRIFLADVDHGKFRNRDSAVT